MKKILGLTAAAAALLAMSTPAFAGIDVFRVPEPMSLSLLAGGIMAIAAVKGLRRK